MFGKIQKSLHMIHWIVLSLSVVVTLVAWDITKSQEEKRISREFDFQVESNLELIQERLQKYEDALWSGVASINMNQGNIDLEKWRVFSNSLNVEDKYPGINGIGVIFNLDHQNPKKYMKTFLSERSYFKIYPKHERHEKWPIVYIEPEEANKAAVGLDMAHELNRFSAAKRARDLGEAQITGPITLVQDASKTSGFLFFAPFYSNGKEVPNSISEREAAFKGLVYAPFIVKKLMEGTLKNETRNVDFRISDGGAIIYDELNSQFEDFDPNPLFKAKKTINFYGRSWNFDLWSSKSFRRNKTSSQSEIILIGGFVIDALLFVVFLLLSRSKYRAEILAKSLTKDIEDRNEKLEKFIYVTSHDLKAPSRQISTFIEVLLGKEGDTRLSEVQNYLKNIQSAAQNMSLMLKGLLEFATSKNTSQEPSHAKISLCMEKVVQNMKSDLESSHTQLKLDIASDDVNCQEFDLIRIFQNLIDNAIKYKNPKRDPEISIKAEDHDKKVLIRIKDNGIGFPIEQTKKKFELFKRFHSDSEIIGTGVGLAVTQQTIEGYGGKLWVESTSEAGTEIHITLAKSNEYLEVA